MPVPSNPLSKLATRTRYVPVTGARGPLISAAFVPEVSPRTLPLGAHKRIQGRKSLLSTISLTLTVMRFPDGTVIVHTSRSPGAVETAVEAGNEN